MFFLLLIHTRLFIYFLCLPTRRDDLLWVFQNWFFESYVETPYLQCLQSLILVASSDVEGNSNRGRENTWCRVLITYGRLLGMTSCLPLELRYTRALMHILAISSGYMWEYLIVQANLLHSSSWCAVVQLELRTAALRVNGILWKAVDPWFTVTQLL